MVRKFIKEYRTPYTPRPKPSKQLRQEYLGHRKREFRYRKMKQYEQRLPRGPRLKYKDRKLTGIDKRLNSINWNDNHPSDYKNYHIDEGFVGAGLQFAGKKGKRKRRKSKRRYKKGSFWI